MLADFSRKKCAQKLDNGPTFKDFNQSPCNFCPRALNRPVFSPGDLASWVQDPQPLIESIFDTIESVLASRRETVDSNSRNGMFTAEMIYIYIYYYIIIYIYGMYMDVYGCKWMYGCMDMGQNMSKPW